VDAFLVAIWVVRLAFLALLYLFLVFVVRALLRDLRAASREPTAELGRLVVVASPSGEPPLGTTYPLDAVTGIGRDVNNAVVVDDPFASAEHAVLTFRGRAWYVEDAGSTNGTYVNGSRVDRLAPVRFGDEVQVGQVRFRLERGRAA
jgi:pSer/pThr/pTyr-binding forkhead associated (FHA) protein